MTEEVVSISEFAKYVGVALKQDALFRSIVLGVINVKQDKMDAPRLVIVG